MAVRADGEQRLERHPVRAALLELIGRDGTGTATTAARELGGSPGLYSFHLRRLARFGIIEEAPSGPGRVRPWRLARAGAARSSSGSPSGSPSGSSGQAVGDVE